MRSPTPERTTHIPPLFSRIILRMQRGAVVVRACWRSNLAGGLAGVALVLSGVAPPAHAATPVIEEALEQEETLQVQSKQASLRGTFPG